MKRFRKVIFWCHLPLGVTGGLIILTMAVTGVLLAYERQVTAWADARSYSMSPAPHGPALTVEELLAKAREIRPNTSPTTITLRADSAMPAQVGYNGGGIVLMDPYTGEFLSEGSKRVRGFFRVVTDLHRWLGAQGENRNIARAITGACNLAFLILVVSGFYLWWPRQWSWRMIRGVIWFKGGLSGKSGNFNWHNTIGFWSALPLFIVVFSALPISYTWAGNLVYRLVGETPPPQRSAANSPRQQNTTGQNQKEPSLVGLDQLWNRASNQIADWKSITMRLPSSGDIPVSFTIDKGEGGQPQKRAQLILARNTADVVSWEPFSSQSRGRQLRSILRFAHTGEVAGIVGQTIACLVSAGAAFLVWTGFALAYRRLRTWSAKRANRSKIIAADVESVSA